MNWLKISENWDIFLQQARLSWPRLSYHELVLTRGERPRLCTALQERYELSADEADEAVAAWQERLVIKSELTAAD